jgi:uncharacterized protein
MLDHLDARAGRVWAVRALAALGRCREEIDALNVYPVPDADTGTNLFLTFEAACAAVAVLPVDAELPDVATHFARGALLGARGNSGIIVAQLMRGWGEALAGRSVMDAAGFRDGLRAGDRTAWAALATPVEGTVLSVSRAVAEAVGAAEPDASLARLTRLAVDVARHALLATTDQLAALRRAGVVDAGGRGLVELLCAMDDVVHDRAPVARPVRGPRTGSLTGLGPPSAGCAAVAIGGYEVMFQLGSALSDAESSDAESSEAESSDAETVDTGTGAQLADRLRPVLAALGDCVIVGVDGGCCHVHVHTADAGALVQAVLPLGRLSRLRIAALPPAAASQVSLVVGADGPALAQAFADVDAVLLEGVHRATTADFLRAIEAAPSRQVVVLPNDERGIEPARVAADLAAQQGRQVVVIPTRAQVQGLAAVAVHDPYRSLADDVARMSAAAGAVREGAVLAVGSAEGRLVGQVQGEVTVEGVDLLEVALEVVDKLLAGGGELVSLLAGAALSESLLRDLVARVGAAHPDVEVLALVTGQREVLLVGVE